MYEDLNNNLLQVLSFLKKELRTKGYPPSVREICHAVGFKSTSTVHSYLAKLESKGYIRRDPTKPRAIEILDNDTKYGNNEHTDTNLNIKNIPLVGNVTAGNPILAVENIEHTFPLPSDFVNNENDVFMLNVKGDSMINAAILDGDMIVVKKQSYASNSDIVVALIDDEEATVKRFFLEENHVRLQPENDFMEPIIVDDVKILGKVVAVLRKM
ncbi:transcriptional repressor LexA [Serpentinicella sp. ANB-PHB4]|uniref:transcriptional repressor LexA n=1 Tax=Serpentinicella sp. ANB-PHB4 TaxID=3074076 RepID=UPI0028599CA4|nr:transcriptional repressor LexA [Serpentinicella sp. ANB-PHB4]MDR5658153.1 transcriptional repressor LexA [Serpentinicella sp. ANB-PHB4]